MTNDKALELYEQCDRELPGRGDLGSFKRLIGAFARAALATPPAAALAPVAKKRVTMPPIGEELYEHYVSMSAQTHEALIKEYASACIAAPTRGTPKPVAPVAIEKCSDALDESNGLLVAILHERRDPDEILQQVADNREAIEFAAPTPSTSAPKNCQTGWADFCKASQHDGVACPADSCDIDDGVRKDHSPSTPAPVAIQDAADLIAIYDVFHIGSKARSISTLLVNCENADRRADCLSGIEQLFTYEVPDEDCPDELTDECDLNWGHDRAEYVEAFKAALPAFIARNPQYAAPPTRPGVGDAREQVLEDESDGSWAAFELSHHAQMSDKMDRWPVWLDAWYAAMLAPQSSEKEVGETKEMK